MQFDIRSFLESGRKPFEAHFEADFSKADFGGYSVNTPAVCDFTATLTEDGAELLLIRILNCRAMRTVVSTSRSSPIRS